MAGEDLIQFIWKHRLFEGMSLETTCGQELIVLHPGEQNIHAGPDFFNARIRLGNIIWAGNVEMHQRASDWYRHGHHMDPAYNNVVLHVVDVYDSDIHDSHGRIIPAWVPDYPDSLNRRYHILKEEEDWLACSTYLKELPEPRLKFCLQMLGNERLLQKSKRIPGLQTAEYKDREDVFYQTLAKGFGLPLNSLPFELLAKSIPFHRVIKYRDSLKDLESMLFGQSGLLHSSRVKGHYPASLWERYAVLKHDLPGDPVPRHLWKFLRLRPASFPTLRISQFAFILHHRIPLLETILAAASLTELELILRAGASTYWDSHYLFGKSSPPFPKYLGRQSVSTLIINVIIPFLMALEKAEPRGNYGARAGYMLSQLRAEANQVIRHWQRHGVHVENAGESQALLQLFNVYCKQKRCLHCQIGIALMEAALHENK